MAALTELGPSTPDKPNIDVMIKHHLGHSRNTGPCIWIAHQHSRRKHLGRALQDTEFAPRAAEVFVDAKLAYLKAIGLPRL